MSATTLNNNILVQTLGVSTAVLAALALKYPDRAVFDEYREDVAHKSGWPLIGSLPALIQNADKIHDFFLNGFTINNSMTT